MRGPGLPGNVLVLTEWPIYADAADAVAADREDAKLGQWKRLSFRSFPVDLLGRA